MLHWFLLYSKVNQLYVCVCISNMYPLTSGLPFHSGHHRAVSQVPCLYSMFSLCVCAQLCLTLCELMDCSL